MKLHRLDLEGFGPFRSRQSVDFDAFSDDGIFLITGRTGAGKSSVLDGVCYALFGGVPRYDGAERRLRSDHSRPDDPTEVALEFTSAGRRWRVTRSPEYERPKRRGDGVTTEPHRALLERLDGDRWVGVAARPVDVAAELDRVVGLSQQQFLQVILLAQNRFARFLLARNDERQTLLRTLFGTRTYEQYQQQLDDRRKEAERAMRADDETMRLLLDEGERVAQGAGVLADAGEHDGAEPSEQAEPSERLARLVRAAERADYRVTVAVQRQSEAEETLDAALARERALTALHERQQQRLDARRAQDDLDAAQAGVERDRERLSAAVSAEALRPALDAADAAAETAADAAAAEGGAEAAWLAAGERHTGADDLRARDDALSNDLAHASGAREDEALLLVADAERTASQRAAETAEASFAELDERCRAVPTELAELDRGIAAVAGARAARDAARIRLAELTAVRDAAREAEALVAPREEAERAAIAAATAVLNATSTHTALLRRRLDSAAGDLARTLVDGEGCPVCGATTHPHPAPPSDAPVSDAEIDAADAAKQAALAADRAAAETARTAREAHTAAAARAGGRDVSTLDEAVAEAAAALTAAEDDVLTGDDLGERRAALVARDAEAAAAREEAAAEASAHRQSAALATQRSEMLRASVDAARGAFATVADRIAELEGRRGMLRALIDATAEAAAAARRLTDAVADRDRRAAAADFADAAAARAALLPAAERERLDETVRAHDVARRSVAERLLEIELALAGDDTEPVDLTPVTAEVATAREELTAAASALGTAGEVATRLRDLAGRADAAHDGIAAKTAHHDIVARLANTVAGRAPNTHRMTLETFLLAAELEEIVHTANRRLGEMSAGRYRLQHTDALAARGAASGLGLAVLDAFTGQARPPQSLSGGETFLASLALALGLAEVVTARAGGIRLDTLFIDEGFGSLDEETLDLAMRALDELRQGGRTVGVISHVAAMREQLPAQLAVEITPQGPSVIRQATALA